MDNKSLIKSSYERITPFFYWISKEFESKTRVKSLELSKVKNGTPVLIIAPPTEFYIDELLKLNPEGENHLLYFSKQMKQKAEKRLGKAYNYEADIGSIERLPYEDNKFEQIFAYCYLDFLDYRERNLAVEEIKRVLKLGGKLLANYLAFPASPLEKICVYFFAKLNFIFKGIRVVEVESILKQCNFKNVLVLRYTQKGFPIGLAYAEK